MATDNDGILKPNQTIRPIMVPGQAVQLLQQLYGLKVKLIKV